MIINKKIKEAVSFNPTKMSHQMSVHDLCKKIMNNNVTLPLYQRDVSWTLKKSVDLFNYQLFGKAPVAPISINQTSDGTVVPQVSFIDRELIDDEEIKAGHQSIVDGQQRLTTNFKAYMNHDDFRNIVLDVSKAKFMIVEIGLTNYQIPIGILLNQDDDVLEKYLGKKNLITKLFTILVSVRSKLRDYNYTLNIAENLTEDEQIEWFEVLNNAGSRVTSLQMSFSKLKLHNFDIYIEYTKPFKELISSYGYDELFSPFTTNVSYPISALNPAYEVILKKNHNNNYAPIPSDTKENLLTKLDIVNLRQIVNLSLKSLEIALKFIERNSLSDQITRMDYILYLSGFFSFNHNELGEEEEGILIDWFKNINFDDKSNRVRREIFNNLLNIFQNN